MKTILALETSCDETAIAILRGHELLASEVASQIAEHDKYGGVVPEIASRNHLVQAPRLLERACRDAQIDLAEIDAFAATSGPGLASSLMIGASLAKGLAIAFGKPYLAINHLEGHLLSPFFVASASSRCSDASPVRTHGQDARATIKPNVALVASGGHTLSVYVREVCDYQIIGRTIDDAAGEAFDKVAKMLGLGYPGGPEIEKCAGKGDPARFDLPRSMPESEDFSFSGLKTAVRYLLPKVGRDVSDGTGRATDEQRTEETISDDQDLADVCASFQQAVIDVLIRKIVRAAKAYPVDLVTLSGGVSCNQELCRQLEAACRKESLQFQAAAGWLSTDNAAMIAFAAMIHLERGLTSRLAEEIDPNLALGPSRTGIGGGDSASISGSAISALQSCKIIGG